MSREAPPLVSPPVGSVAPVPRLIIAGVSSGSGKTTVSVGLMTALRRRGLKVQGAKVGPDYLDPQHHVCVTGRPSCNLDTWLCSDDAVRSSLLEASSGADLTVIEGVMGLYDGHGPRDEEGSTAHAAIVLGAPVVLVLDARGMARTAGAVVLGMKQLDPRVHIAGVILNRVSSARHAAFLRPSIEEQAGVPVLGSFLAGPDAFIPSRHLGLARPPELCRRVYEALADRAAGSLDIDSLIETALAAPPLESRPGHLSNMGSQESTAPVTIAVARDGAFQFYYPENFRMLEALGARLRFFSPLDDDYMDEGADLLYLGGGYPELYARRLAVCDIARMSILSFARKGGPVYAECGGLQYLGEQLQTTDGTDHLMTGVLPVRTVMRDKRVALGYVELVATESNPFLPSGSRVRAHEFHYSSAEAPEGQPCGWRLEKAGNETRDDGFTRGNVLASYAHVHFSGAPELAQGLISAARRYRDQRGGQVSDR